MSAELTPDERDQRNDARSDIDDGIRGPGGDRFRAGLTEAGAALGFVASERSPLAFVHEGWHGRTLTIDRSTFGAQGRTTGHRWIAIRLSTATLGPWTDPPTRTSRRAEGLGLPLSAGPTLPNGVWHDDPPLLADLWCFAVALLPHLDPTERERWVHLNVGPDFVVWHLRSSVLDGPTLIAAIVLLERVASYAERNDAALSARLGRAPGVTSARRLELLIAVGAVGVVALIVLVVLVLTVVV